MATKQSLGNWWRIARRSNGDTEAWLHANGFEILETLPQTYLVLPPLGWQLSAQGESSYIADATGKLRAYQNEHDVFVQFYGGVR